jgi:hypothetical protein
MSDDTWWWPWQSSTLVATKAGFCWEADMQEEAERRQRAEADHARREHRPRPRKGKAHEPLCHQEL